MLSPGDRVDRYEIVRALAEGGMAVVYLVRHTELDTLHALKMLTLAGEVLQDRLRSEGRGGRCGSTRGDRARRRSP